MIADRGLTFELDEELSEGSLVAVVATMSPGTIIQLYAETELVGRTPVLRQFAIYAATVTSNELGMNVLRRLARAAMEEFDVDCIRIEEARRTSGANPGRTIRQIEFHR